MCCLAKEAQECAASASEVRRGWLDASTDEAAAAPGRARQMPRKMVKNWEKFGKIMVSNG